MNSPKDSLYDRDDYYLNNQQGSRLSPVFDRILALLEWERVLAVMSPLRGKRGKILDVGAGDGKFLNLMRRRGFSGVGTTASQRSARAAAKIFSIDLRVAVTLDEVTRDGPFILITYWHVFEHLKDASQHIMHWRGLLSDDGVLVVEVPSIDSLGARLCYRAWLGSDPVHHINHMPTLQLCKVIKDAGFDIGHLGQFSWKFSYVFLWSALLGRCFPGHYSFDSILGLLKSPRKYVFAAPLKSLNAFASLLYLAPGILLMIVVGLVLRKGEVTRVVAYKRGA